MDQVFQFLLNHWALSLLLVVIVMLIIATEMNSKLTGLKMVTPQLATSLMNKDDAVVVDIRDHEAFKSGHITNAVNIPADQIEQKLNKLNKFKTKPIIVICKVGQQSNKVASKLQSEGFNTIYGLKGGIQAWQDASMPLVK